MGLKRFLVVCAILVAAVSYWVYDPLPPGYSASSRRQFQVMVGMFKVINCVVSETVVGLKRVLVVCAFSCVFGFCECSVNCITFYGPSLILNLTLGLRRPRPTLGL